MEVRPSTGQHLFEVQSETEPDKWYQVFANGTVIKCTCKGFLSHKTCKHLEVVQQYLRETEGAIEPEEDDHFHQTGNMVVPPATNGLSRWIKKIHGRDFIMYEGLLAMAHDQGLTELGAEFISVSAELAIAFAWATFQDGKKFWESGDATPQNVHAQVKAHYPRVALTRAKARVLRDALNIGTVAVEELGEVE